MAPTRDCHERVRHEYQPNTQTLSWPNADRCGDMRDLVHTNLLLLGWRSGQDSNLYENLSALITGFKPDKRAYAPLHCVSLLSFASKWTSLWQATSISGGKGGIRTHDGCPYQVSSLAPSASRRPVHWRIAQDLNPQPLSGQLFSKQLPHRSDAIHWRRAWASNPQRLTPHALSRGVPVLIRMLSVEAPVGLAPTICRFAGDRLGYLAKAPSRWYPVRAGLSRPYFRDFFFGSLSSPKATP